MQHEAYQHEKNNAARQGLFPQLDMGYVKIGIQIGKIRGKKVVMGENDLLTSTCHMGTSIEDSIDQQDKSTRHILYRIKRVYGIIL